MLVPSLIWVISFLEFNARIAYRTYDDNDAIVIHWQLAFMVVCAGMFSAEDYFTTSTLEGQEILLMTEFIAAVLTNVSKFHLNFINY